MGTTNGRFKVFLDRTARSVVYILGLVFLTFLAFLTLVAWGLPHLAEAAASINQAFDPSNVLEQRSYARDLLTILTVILTINFGVVAFGALAFYLGLQAHFRRKTQEIEDELDSQLSELMDAAEKKTTDIVTRKEEQLHDFEATRLHIASAQVSLELSLREWNIVDCIQSQPLEESARKYEEFKSLLRAYKHCEYAHKRVSDGEEALHEAKSVGANTNSLERKLKLLGIMASNNSVFFLAWLFRDEFKALLGPVQNTGQAPKLLEAREKAIQFKGVLEEFDQSGRRFLSAEEHKRQIIFHKDSILLACWILELSDKAELRQRARSLMKLADESGIEKMGQKYRDRYRSLL